MREDVFRAWVNKHNITVAAVSVVLVVEGIFQPHLVPATATVYASALSAVAVGAKLTLVGMSAHNLKEAHYKDGVSGLFTLDSLFGIC